MKKFLVFCICLFLLCGCTKESKESKVVRSVNDFENASIKAGFSVADNMGSYAGVSYITASKIATSGDISVEMVVYADSDSAKEVQDNQIESFKKIKNTATTENKEKGANFYKFWMISNGYYMVNSRIDNTLIFCKTPFKNKEKIEVILNELGY